MQIKARVATIEPTHGCPCITIARITCFDSTFYALKGGSVNTVVDHVDHAANSAGTKAQSSWPAEYFNALG